ncbi:endolytic transglycosylase MltG [Lachnobacterium bovis]|uniref:UPF0755 protein n=1 Tax=Lachnobacterium bovis TaxID=140626 RepID=A0A1H9RG89_9FIRM|nr:endolytic transglycosylase MltG [Lachnobacterium bovis]SER71712.1 UPF0755 protein [Lachnobacterium bovis]
MNINKVLFNFIKIAFSIMIILLLVYVLSHFAGKAYGFGYSLFNDESVTKGEGKEVKIVIKSGMSNKEIGELLKKKGLIKDSNLFWIQSEMVSLSSKVRPGTYVLNTSMSVDEIINKMIKQNETSEKQIQTQ